MLKKLLNHNVDFIIHLGDLYYSGTDNEFNENMIQPLKELIYDNTNIKHKPCFLR